MFVAERSEWEGEPLELPPTTVGGLLDRARESHGNTEAVALVAYPGTPYDLRWTYRELHARAERLAAALIASGCRRGARAAIWAPNVPEWLVAEYAVAKAGMVLVTINPTYQTAELEYALALTDVDVLFYLPEWGRFDLGARLSRIQKHLEPRLTVVLEPDALAELCDRGGDDVAAVHARQREVTPADVAQVQFTSGTSGAPKGVQLTHGALVHNSHALMERWRVGLGEKWCSAAPLFHIVGNAMMALGCAAVGATYLPIVWFDADRILDTIERERVQYLQSVPTTLIALLDRQRDAPRDLSSLELVEIGGAPVPPALGHRLRAEVGAELVNCYGLTETSGCVTQALRDDGDRGFETVGPPVPGVSLRIVARDGGGVVPIGEAGELHARGYVITPGYLKDEERTNEAIADGWFRTGDLARMSPSGHVTIVGRLNGVIRRGAEAIDPTEIENLMLQHPGVREATVVGVPDDFFGEIACAVVEVTPPLGADEVRAWMKGRISHQKIPAHVLIEGDVPRTPSGKVRRRELRAIVLDRLGIAGEEAR